MSIRPDYYKNEDGHDIFWRMEHGEWPMDYSLGFCVINEAKYKERAGRKTTDKTIDLEKAQTYHEEWQRLLALGGTDDKLESKPSN